MKTVLRWFGAAIGLTALLITAFVFVMRFTDGPLFVFPGGPFASGEPIAYESVDWNELAAIREIEFQLVTPARSRTTWFIVHDDRPYIPCGFCTNRLLKRWPRQLEIDDHVVLRIDGKRISGRARRVEHASPENIAVRKTHSAKYAEASDSQARTEVEAARDVVGAVQYAEEIFSDPSSEPEPTSWLYRIDPR